MNCRFVAEQQDIDVSERLYVRGEAGSAETCDSFCSALGRGHVHVLPCDPDRCDLHGPSPVDGRRHSRIAYTDGTEPPGLGMRPKDELTHNAYYDALGFEDPFGEEQREQFALCGFACGSQAHDAHGGQGEWIAVLS